MRRTIPALTLLALALLALGGASAAQAKVAIGIADNKSDMFTDPRFAALKVKYVRVMVPYDTLNDAKQKVWLDGWMAGAKAAGEKPLVTLDRSRRRPSYNPPAAQMAKTVTALHKRYPFL